MTELNTAIAIMLGWTWAEDWGCFVPSWWPTKATALTSYCDGELPQGLTQRLRLNEGAFVSDDDVPQIPSYLTDPHATAKVWAWLEGQANLYEVSFVYQGYSGQVLCVIRYWLGANHFAAYEAIADTRTAALLHAVHAVHAALQASTP